MTVSLVAVVIAKASNESQPLQINTNDYSEIDVPQVILSSATIDDTFTPIQSSTTDSDSDAYPTTVLPIKTIENATTVSDIITFNSTKATLPKLYKKADPRKRKIERKSVIISPDLTDWKCPNISSSRNLECGCDMPHTLRCSGDVHSLQVIYENELEELLFKSCCFFNIENRRRTKAIPVYCISARLYPEERDLLKRHKNIRKCFTAWSRHFIGRNKTSSPVSLPGFENATASIR